MVLGNLQSQSKKLHHAGAIDLHESVVFGGKHQRGRMAEIYETKISTGAYLPVQHGRDFTRIVILIPPQSVPRSDRLRQPEIDVFEKTWSCFPVSIEFRKHECMKGVVYCGSNFGRDDPMPLRINQQHASSRIEIRQILGDSQLLR